MRDLSRNGNPVETARNEIQLTTFKAVLSNHIVRWEVRKAKPADADAALQAAVETHYFLEISGLIFQTSGVNNISTESTLDAFTKLVHSLRTEIQVAVAQLSPTDRNASQNNQRDRSDNRNSNRHRSSSPGLRRNNIFSKFRKPNQPNELNTARNSINQRNISEDCFSIKSNNSKRDQNSGRNVAMKKNANLVAELTTPVGNARFVSIVAELATAVSDAKF